jgi:hypothetical protein
MSGFPDFKSSVIDHRQYGELEKRFFASNKALAAAEATIDRLHEALGLIAAGTVCPDLFPNETNGDALAAKTAMTIALAALEVSGSQSDGD